jgi:hypothetical protein
MHDASRTAMPTARHELQHETVLLHTMPCSRGFVSCTADPAHVDLLRKLPAGLYAILQAGVFTQQYSAELKVVQQQGLQCGAGAILPAKCTTRFPAVHIYSMPASESA